MNDPATCAGSVIPPNDDGLQPSRKAHRRQYARFIRPFGLTGRGDGGELRTGPATWDVAAVDANPYLMSQAA
jgi:hypothetical protein